MKSHENYDLQRHKKWENVLTEANYLAFGTERPFREWLRVRERPKSRACLALTISLLKQKAKDPLWQQHL